MTRQEALDIVQDMLKFPFEESELPPSVRRAIGYLGDQLDELHGLEERAKMVGKITIALAVLGPVFILAGISALIEAAGIGVLLAMLGAMMIFGAYHSHGKAKRLWEEVEVKRRDVDDLARRVSESAYQALKVIYQQRMFPQQAQQQIDLASVIRAMGGPLMLKPLNCPHCGGKLEPVDIPSSGSFFRCKYCGNLIYAADLVRAWSSYLPQNLVQSVIGVPKVGQQQALKVCPSCGRTVRASARFCPYCGYRFT